MGDQVMNPPQPGKLKVLAKAQGVTVRKLLLDALKKHGSIFRAAVALDVNPNSIQYWMTRNNYRIEKRLTLVKVAKTNKTEERAG